MRRGNVVDNPEGQRYCQLVHRQRGCRRAGMVRPADTIAAAVAVRELVSWLVVVVVVIVAGLVRESGVSRAGEGGE